MSFWGTTVRAGTSGVSAIGDTFETVGYATSAVKAKARAWSITAQVDASLDIAESNDTACMNAAVRTTDRRKAFAEKRGLPFDYTKELERTYQEYAAKLDADAEQNQLTVVA